MPRKRGRKSRSTWGSNDDAGAGRRRLRYWADLHDGRGYTRHSKTIVGTKTDGDEELARLRVSHSRDAPVPTVGEMWDRFERPKIEKLLESGKIARQTMKTYESKWKNHVGPRWGNVPVSDVRAYDVQTWLSSLTESNGKLCRIVLKLTLDQATILDVIPANPAAREFAYGDPVRKAKGTYDTCELAAIWKSCRGSRCEAPFILMAYGGLRVGEACGMRLENISFVDGVALFRVEEQLTQSGDFDARLKTREKGIRYAGIPEPWSTRIREIVDRQPREAQFLNDRGDGKPVSRNRVSESWRECIEASGVRYLPMKDLRSTFETRLHWDEDVPIEHMARILGHTSTRTTDRSYDRPTDSHLAQLALRIARKQNEEDDLGQS